MAWCLCHARRLEYSLLQPEMWQCLPIWSWNSMLSLKTDSVWELCQQIPHFQWAAVLQFSPGLPLDILGFFEKYDLNALEKNKEKM